MFNKQKGFIFSLILTDCLAFVLSFIVSFAFIFSIYSANVAPYSFTDNFIYVVYLIPIWILFVDFFVGHGLFYTSFFNLFVKILKTTSLFMIFLFALMFLLKSDFSRLFLIFTWIKLTLFTFVFRYIFKRIIAYVIYRLNIRNNLLVIGKKVRRFKKVFNNNYINKVYYYPYLLDTGNIEKLKLLSIKKGIKEIIIIDYLIKDEEFLSLCDWAQTNNVYIKIIPNETQMTRDKIVLDDTLGIPVISLITNPVNNFDYFIKRVMDILISLVLLIILSPLFLVIAILIKSESKGPIIYKHRRLGFNKKEFYCYKFRSMCSDANKKIKNLIDNSLKQNSAFLKLEEDSRITKVGKFIRKYSLDELPQLFNVLKGEMSLVGPRPIVSWELEQIKKIYHNYSYNKMFIVLPGITGLWQCSGRSLLSDEKRLELEIFYADNWSLALDIKILLKTVIVVIFHTGAY